MNPGLLNRVAPVFLARSLVDLNNLQKSKIIYKNLQPDLKKNTGLKHLHISTSEIQIDFADRIHKRV